MKKRRDSERARLLRPNTDHLTSIYDGVDSPTIYKPLSSGRVRASACRVLKPQPPAQREESAAFRRQADAEEAAPANLRSPLELAEAARKTPKTTDSTHRLYIQTARITSGQSYGKREELLEPKPPQQTRFDETIMSDHPLSVTIDCKPTPPATPKVTTSMDIGTQGWLNAIRQSVTDNIYVDDSRDPISPFSYISTVRSSMNELETFVYANQFPGSSDPYHLMLVPHSQIDRSLYYVFSARGVTQHVDDKAVCFSTLNEWLQSYRAYKLTYSIRFFSKYRRWRTFLHWKGCVRSESVQTAKEYLIDNHLLLHPFLSAPLLQIRKICRQIAHMSVARVSNHTCTLSQFVKAQLDHRKHCLSFFKSKLSEINFLTKNACKQAFKAVLEERFQTSTATTPTAAGKPSKAVKSIQLNSGKEVDLSDDPYLGPTHTELSHARGMCRRLFGFIKVIDLILTDSLLDFSTRSLIGLYSLIQEPDDEPIPEHRAILFPEEGSNDAALYELLLASNITTEEDLLQARQASSGVKHPVKTSSTRNHPAGIPSRILKVLGVPSPAYKPPLSCQIKLNTHNLELEMSPKPEELKQQVLSTVVDSVRAILGSFKPLYSPSNLQALIGETDKSILATIQKELPDEENVPIMQTVFENKRFLQIESLISTAFDHSAYQLARFADEYQSFISIYAHNRDLDPKQIEKDEPPVSFYSDLLQTLHVQQSSIMSIRTSEESGIYTVDLSLLRDVLLPSPDQAKAKVTAVLPIIFKKRNTALLDNLQEGINKLTAKVETVQAMADLIKYHDVIVGKLEEYQSTYDILSQHLNLLQTNSIDLPPETAGSWFHGTVPAFAELRKCIVTAEQTREEKIANFSQTIEDELQRCAEETLQLEIDANDPLVFEEDREPQVVLEHLSDINDKLSVIEATERHLCSHQELFGLEQNKNPRLPIVAKNISDKKKIWASLTEWNAIRAKYESLNFMDSDIAEVAGSVQKYTRLVNQATRTFPNNTVVLKLRVLVDEIRIMLPVVEALQNEHLQSHHFDLIHAIVGSSNFTTYGHLVELSIIDVKEDILQISVTATEEAKLHSELQTLSKGWQSLEFEMYPHDHPSAKDMFVVGDTSRIIQQLEDSIVSVSTISGNRYCPASLRDKCGKWSIELHTVVSRLAKWNTCQDAWLYLFAVFSNHNLCRHWPQNAKNFGTTDRQLRERMKKLSEAPYVYRSVLSDLTFSHLDLVQRDLDQLLSVLATNIDEKRTCHPRYYFLSDTQLIHFLSNAKEPLAVVQYLPVIFQSVNGITLEDENITAVSCVDGETLHLPKGLRVTNDSDRWIERLDEVIISTLRKHSRVIATFLGQMASGTIPKIDHGLPYPTQVICAMHDAAWSDVITKSLHASTIDDDSNTDIQYPSLSVILDGCNGELQRLSGLVKKINHTMVSKHRLFSIILRLCSHKKILEGLAACEPGSSAAFFDWDCQLKCSWSASQQGICYSILNHTFNYGYEFQGSSKRSVITPITNKAFILIAQAQQCHQNVVFSGPSGVGKTEIVKELAVTLGRHCLVMHASESLSTAAVDKWMSGLCQMGAWGCISSFPSLSTPLLSLLAQQLSSIRQAMISSSNGDPDVKINPMGHINSFKVNKNFGLFATSTSQITSSALPAAMRHQFRTFTCLVPDVITILQVSLFAAGIPTERASCLALKISKLCDHLKKHIMPQEQYTNAFSTHLLMEITNAVCAVGGAVTDEEVAAKCKEAISPRLLEKDTDILSSLLTNLFSGGITVSLQTDCDQLNINSSKITELNLALSSHHSVIVLGSSGCGKTTIIKEWCENNKAKCHFFNPQTISVGDLFGSSSGAHQKTSLWAGGIVTEVIMQAQSKDILTNIVFDSSVGSSWIGSLYPFFTKIRHFTSADHTFRISRNINVLVETESISDLPPSMSSLCKVVYIPDGSPVYLAKTWLVSSLFPILKAIFPKEVAFTLNDYISSLFETHIRKLVQQVLSYKSVTSNACIMVNNTIKIMTALFPEAWSADDDVAYQRGSSEQVKQVITKAKIASDMLFSYCALWGFAGTIPRETDRESFSTFARVEMTKLWHNTGDVQSLYDVRPDFQELKFLKWEVPLTVHENNKKLSLKNNTVPYIDTMDNMKYKYLVRLLLLNGTHVTLSGSSGVGKSSLLKQCLTGTGIVERAVFNNLTKLSTSRQLLFTSLQKSDRKDGNQLPIMVFIDDVNLCPDTSIHEGLRYFIEHQSLYHHGQLHTNNNEGKITIATCANTDTGVSIGSRLTRLLTTVSVNSPTEEGVTAIVGRLLSGYYFTQRFSQEVCDASHKVISQASAELLSLMTATFVKTDSHPHYVFTLRTVMSVISGMCQVVPRTCTSTKSLISLWIHESCRAFQDRLISEFEKKSFCRLIQQTLLRCAPPGSWKQDAIGTQRWCSFLRPTGDPDATERVYEQLTEQQQNQLPELIEYYATELYDTKMDLVFFKDCCEHILRILRVLQQKQQNLLLFGTSGCGRQTLTRLASVIIEYECLSLDVDKCYATESFQTDMTQLYETAAINKNHIVLLLCDKQLQIPDVASAINHLLLGEFDIPGLFSKEEQARHDWSSFLTCAADHIHLVLSLTPGEAFRKLTREFPSVINCSTVNYFVTWPYEALMEVTSRKIDKEIYDIEDLSIFPKAHSHSVLTALRVRKEVRSSSPGSHNTPNITPSVFFDFLSLFSGIYAERLNAYELQHTRLVTAIDTYEHSKELALQMRAKLSTTDKELNIVSDELLNIDRKITDQQEKVQAAKAVVTKFAGELHEQNTLCMAASHEYQQLLPNLTPALKGIDSLSKQDIVEVRSYSSAPRSVLLTAEGVMILLKEKKPGDWQAARQVMTKTDFLDRLQNFDKSTITNEVLVKLEKIIKDDEFSPEKVGLTGSYACRSMCIWVRMMYKFSVAEKKALPKKEQHLELLSVVESLQAQADEATAEHLSEMNLLDELQRSKTDMERQVNKHTHSMTQVKSKVETADALCEVLSDQIEKWNAECAAVQTQISICMQTSFIAAAKVAYSGPFSPLHRKQLETHLIELLQTHVECTSQSHKDFKAYLGTNPNLGVSSLIPPSTLREWELANLPTDYDAIESTAILHWCCTASYSKRWPLVVDPHSQIQSWLPETYSRCGLKTLPLPTHTDSFDVHRKFSQQLEHTMEGGTPLVVSDVEKSLDTSLLPILHKRIETIPSHERDSSGHSHRLVLHADSFVNYDPDFKLILMSNSMTSTFDPDVWVLSNVVTFGLTPSSLKHRFVSEIINAGLLDVEEDTRTALSSVVNNKRQLAAYEEQMISDLQGTKGAILENTKLVNSLQKLSQTSGFVKKQISEAELRSSGTTRVRDSFATVAERGSLWYAALQKLQELDPSYLFSLSSIKSCVINSLSSILETDDTPNTLNAIVTSNLFKFSSYVIKREHQVTFACYLAIKISESEGNATPNSWELIVEDLPEPATNEIIPPFLNWLSGNQWSALQSFPNENTRITIREALMKNPEAWKQWSNDSKFNESEPMPLEGGKQLEDWEYLRLVKILKPGYLYEASILLIKKSLSDAPTQFGVSVSADDIYSWSSPTAPMMIIIHEGAGQEVLDKIIDNRSKEHQVVTHSFAGNLTPSDVKATIDKSRKLGECLVIHNIHTAQESCLQMITTTVNNQQLSCHPQFRLVLVGSYTDNDSLKHVPSKLFEISIKIRCEPHSNIKQILRSEFIENYLETPDSDSGNRGAAYCLSMFHAAFQTRLQLDCSKWNSELTAISPDSFKHSLSLLDNLLVKLSDSQSDGYKLVRGIIADVYYGGLGLSKLGHSVLESMLGRFVNPVTHIEGSALTRINDQHCAPPSWGATSVYYKAVEDLPDVDSVEVLGMGNNSLDDLNARRSQILQRLLRRLSSGSAAPQLHEIGSSFDLSPPSLLSIEDGLFGGHSLSRVLSQEVFSYNKLINIVTASVELITNTSDSNSETQTLRDSIKSGIVPELWLKHSFETNLKDDLMGWMSEFQRRVDFVRSWCNSRSAKLDSFELGSLFHPKILLATAVLDFAASQGMPLSDVHLTFAIDSDSTSGSTYVYNFSDIYCDCCAWVPVSQNLVPEIRGSSKSKLASVTLIPSESPTNIPDGKRISVPLYSHSGRSAESLITEVQLPCGGKLDELMEAGASLVAGCL